MGRSAFVFRRSDAEAHANSKLYSLARIISHYHYSRRSIIWLQIKARGGVPGHKVRKG